MPGGSALTWASHYQDRLSSDQTCLNEWTTMADLESPRPPGAEPGRSVEGGEGTGVPRPSRERAPGLTGSAPRSSEQEQMEQAIRAELWKVLDTSDLESITSKEVGGGAGARAEALRPGARVFLSVEPSHLAFLLSGPVLDAWPRLLGADGTLLSSEALAGWVRHGEPLVSFPSADPPGPGATPGAPPPTVP